jgi:hypothetical protein
VENPSLLLRRDTRQPFSILSGHAGFDLMRCRLGFLVDRDAIAIDVFDRCGVALGSHLGSHIDRLHVLRLDESLGRVTGSACPPKNATRVEEKKAAVIKIKR